MHYRYSYLPCCFIDSGHSRPLTQVDALSLVRKDRHARSGDKLLFNRSPPPVLFSEISGISNDAFYDVYAGIPHRHFASHEF